MLGVQLEPGKLTKEEEQMLAKELPRFQSAEWIYGTRTLIRDNCLSTAEHKTPGGLIRVSLRLDRPPISSRAPLLREIFSLIRSGVFWTWKPY